MNKIFFSDSKRILIDFIGTIVVIPSLKTKSTLLDELSHILFNDQHNTICEPTFDWNDISALFQNKQMKLKENLCVYHESICGIIPTWDIAMYLCSIDEFIKTPDHRANNHIFFAFNNAEKENILKYYPGNLLEKEEKKTMLVHNESWDRIRLKKMLDKNGIPEHYYSLWNEYNNDTITLVDNSNVFWEIVYMDEKGHKSLLKICPTEDEACKCLYDYFVNNKSWLDM